MSRPSKRILFNLCLLGCFTVQEEIYALAQMNAVEIVLYRKGKKALIDHSSVPVLLAACEKLFIEADDTPLLIMTPQRIQAVKQKQNAVEIAYPAVQSRIVLGRTVHFTKLLIPLTGPFSDGTIFYAGPNRSGEEKNASGEEYGAANFVRNSDGIKELRQIFSDLKIPVD